MNAKSITFKIQNDRHPIWVRIYHEEVELIIGADEHRRYVLPRATFELLIEEYLKGSAIFEPSRREPLHKAKDSAVRVRTGE